ncbi:MAG: XdhC/CoxI family protein [Deltaproteobacteria bacterium]|nr:XdhC/CoxI family protein [Deltaproteobacteria bacterium]
MDALVEELIKVKSEGAGAVLITVVESDGVDGLDSGAKCLVRDGRIVLGSVSDPALEQRIVREAAERLAEERSRLLSLETDSGGQADVFFEVMPSPPKLIVVGAGHIAVPLVKIAKLMDYHVVVVDDRILFANRERFPDADEVVVGDMAETVKDMDITPTTYVVLITRGHKYDEPCLRELLDRPAKYIGMIGSKRRIKACFERFKEEEQVSEELISRVYAPIGLDIATETPEEIALGILGEIIKVRRGGKARSLSRK